MHTLIGETEDFVLNPFGDREPVQWPQDRGGVFQRLCPGHTTCSSILDLL